MTGAPLYDAIGGGYTTTRQADPRIERMVHDALGDARRVVNVGAGTGSYEPRDRELVAVEPSEVMIAQRPAGSAPVVRAIAEELPFEDDSFDAAMAVITDHHWSDRARGLRELRRVARSRAVPLTYDPSFADRLEVLLGDLMHAVTNNARRLRVKQHALRSALLILALGSRPVPDARTLERAAYEHARRHPPSSLVEGAAARHAATRRLTSQPLWLVSPWK